MALTPMDITAEVRGLDPDRPDALVDACAARSRWRPPTAMIDSVALDPPDPPACPEALEAVEAADWVVLGPGSWFTSVIPHLMVPELRQALVRPTPGSVVVLNLDAAGGGDRGFGPADHLAVLAEHAPDLHGPHRAGRPTAVAWRSSTLEQAVAAYGAQLVVADVAAATAPPPRPGQAGRGVRPDHASGLSAHLHGSRVD